VDRGGDLGIWSVQDLGVKLRSFGRVEGFSGVEYQVSRDCRYLFYLSEGKVAQYCLKSKKVVNRIKGPHGVVCMFNSM
jgi:hypothetical protein